MVSVLQVLLGLLTALLMMGLGATVRQQDLSRIRTHWKAPLLGFACQVRQVHCTCAGQRCSRRR